MANIISLKIFWSTDLFQMSILSYCTTRRSWKQRTCLNSHSHTSICKSNFTCISICLAISLLSIQYPRPPYTNMCIYLLSKLLNLCLIFFLEKGWQSQNYHEDKCVCVHVCVYSHIYIYKQEQNKHSISTGIILTHTLQHTLHTHH